MVYKDSKINELIKEASKSEDLGPPFFIVCNKFNKKFA